MAKGMGMNYGPQVGVGLGTTDKSGLPGNTPANHQHRTVSMRNEGYQYDAASLKKKSEKGKSSKMMY